MAANGEEREKSPLLASAGLAPTLRASIFLCELPFSLREPGPLLSTQSPCSPFYLFFAGFPGLQGPAGLPGAPGLSLPSVIAGQPGDAGRPGLDGERGKARKPKEGWPSPFVWSLGRACLQSSPIPTAGCAWACEASPPSSRRDTGGWNGLHFAKRVWEGLGTGAPQKAREHYLPRE